MWRSSGNYWLSFLHVFGQTISDSHLLELFCSLTHIKSLDSLVFLWARCLYHGLCLKTFSFSCYSACLCPLCCVEESCAKSPLPVCHIERKCMKSSSDSRCTDCPPTLAVSEGGVATENREGGDKALSPVDLSPVAAIGKLRRYLISNTMLYIHNSTALFLFHAAPLMSSHLSVVAGCLWHWLTYALFECCCDFSFISAVLQPLFSVNCWDEVHVRASQFSLLTVCVSDCVHCVVQRKDVHLL